MHIRPAEAADYPDWLALWQGYCRFYEADVSQEVTDATWARILGAGVPVGCLVAEEEGRLVGFAAYVLHETTFATEPVCYLEDLFTEPAWRRQGVARALIERLAALGREAGWHRLYWQTRADNAAARALYDRLARATDWVRYELSPS